MLGLFALLSLIPLILLYLIRPRPQTIEVPSLLFFIQSSGRNKLSSFLKKFIRDWLFLIQLLILLLLAVSIAQPYTNYQHDITAQNTVLVIDASASMQTYEGKYTRFDKAKDKAKQMLGAKNTIILAKEVPSIVVKEASSNEAAKYINKLQPTESTSRIGDAIILAGEAIQGQEGAVIVLSDFINTGGQDPNIAKSILESKGKVVKFVNTAEKQASNKGIIDIEADRDETTVYVKNFDSTAGIAQLKIGSLKKDLEIPAQSTETVTFQTPPGITQILLVADDDFKADNLAYLSTPKTEKTKIALITNNASVFLRNALEASGNTEVTITKPPVVPTEGYDIYILHKLDMNEILPGTFDALHHTVQDGASLILHVQSNSGDINYKNLLPLKITGTGQGGFIAVEQLNKFTKTIDFGSIKTHFKTSRPDKEFTTLATLGNDTVISLGKSGSGKIVYFGIPESTADFKYSPSYPIFWTELTRYLTGQLDLKNLNYLTKDTLILDREQTIKTPSNTVKQATLLLEESGIYELEDKKIAANLLDEKESEINSETPTGAKSTEFRLEPVKETRKFELEPLLILAAGLIILLEIMYIKLRGDV